MQLMIESMKPTTKSLILKAGGKEYFAKKDSGITSGMVIEAETEDSDFNGKTYTWVKKWKPVAAATPTPQAGTNGSLAAAPWWMPFVSNVTAHAIQAGLVTDPKQLEAWAVAARLAAHKLETDLPY